MKKFYQVLKAIIISLLVLGGIAYVLCYIFLKEQTTYFTECLIDFINKPLPIIGVSILVVLAFIYKCFISTRFGKKTINEFKKENDRLRNEISEQAQLVKEYEEMSKIAYNQAKNDIEHIKDIIAKGYELSRNIKVQKLIEEIRGAVYEENINSDTETKEI